MELIGGCGGGLQVIEMVQMVDTVQILELVEVIEVIGSNWKNEEELIYTYDG